MTIDRDEAGRILQGLAPADELLQFVRSLVEADRLTEMDEIVYFLEKPWKYADEFAAWNAAGRPMDHSESGWSKFVRLIEQA